MNGRCVQARLRQDGAPAGHCQSPRPASPRPAGFVLGFLFSLLQRPKGGERKGNHTKAECLPPAPGAVEMEAGGGGEQGSAEILLGGGPGS